MALKSQVILGDNESIQNQKDSANQAALIIIFFLIIKGY